MYFALEAGVLGTLICRILDSRRMSNDSSQRIPKTLTVSLARSSDTVRDRATRTCQQCEIISHDEPCVISHDRSRTKKSPRHCHILTGIYGHSGEISHDGAKARDPDDDDRKHDFRTPRDLAPEKCPCKISCGSTWQED